PTMGDGLAAQRERNQCVVGTRACCDDDELATRPRAVCHRNSVIGIGHFPTPDFSAVFLSNAYRYPSPPPINTSPLLVTIAPPRLVGEPRRSGSLTPFRSGWLRIVELPSPNGTFQAISPLFRSIAVNTAHGGDTNGKPPDKLALSPPRAKTFEYSTATRGSEPLFFPMRFNPTPLAPLTNKYPLYGSNAAPPQLAPPPCEGRCKVPASDGGVNIGPILYFFISCCASALISGVKSFAFSSNTPWSTNAGGFVGKGWVA